MSNPGPDDIVRRTGSHAIDAFLRRFCDPAELPEDIVRQGRICLMDLTGVAAAGSTTDLARIVSSHASRFFGAGESESPSSILFSNGAHQASAVGAALANGMMIDAFDAHDGHPMTKGHAGCGMFPALLALAETRDLPMTTAEFVAWLVCGYEIAIRCGMALHASAADYHTSGAWVSVAIAATGGAMTGLDDQQMRHAMGIAEYHGPRSPMMRVIDHPSMLKDGSGWGAMAGVSAVELARAGFTGAPAAIVEADAHHNIWDDLGSRWTIGEQYFKPWPVCRWAQPAIQAAEDLRRAHAFDPSDIQSVHVATFHEAVRLGLGRPATTEDAQYALGFPLAVHLVHGEISPHHISGDGLADPAVIAMLDRITLGENSKCNDAFPAERFADVTITLTDNRVLHSGLTNALGDARTPLARSALEDKFRALMDSAGHGERADAILQCIDEGSAPLPELITLIG